MTIAQAVKSILRKEPFYGLFLLGLNKYFDNSIPTACVRKNGINIDLAINEEYWNSLDDKYRIGLICHEASHILFKHLFMEKYYSNQYRLNVAQDLEVNSFLGDVHPDGLHPKQFDFPEAQGTKGYYDNLPEGIENEYFPLDEHNGKDFENLSEAEQKLVENQIDYQVKSVAEEIKKNRGHIPGQFQEYVDGLFIKKEPVFNGKSYFRRMIGTIQDVQLKKTRKRESIRFPDASGPKHKKKSNICIVVDTSGSISNKELCDFFSEIYYVGKAGTNITIIENDATIQKIYQYNGKGNGEIHGRGGTVFNDCVDGYNNHRKEYNRIIFFTDGYVDIDLNIMGPSIGVISSDGKIQDYPGQTIYIPK